MCQKTLLYTTDVHVISDVFTCLSKMEKLPYIINKLNNLRISDKELKKLSCHEQCKLLNNNNPVIAARHFQYRVEVFFKEIILDGPFGKTKYYTIHFEFQEKGSPHVD